MLATNPAALTAYDEQRRALEARIGRLQASWEEQLATANGIQARLLEAARQAGGTIRAAARTSPTADQGWLEDRWEKTRRWVSERVVDWAEGRTSGRQLLVSAGLALGFSVVGGGAAKVGAQALQRLGPRVRDFLAGAGRQTDLNVPRTGPPTASAGGRLPLDRNLVKRIAVQAGVGLDGVRFRIHKSAPHPGMFGQTTRDGVLHLYPNAFRSEEELVRTLGHERTHVWQVKTYGYLTTTKLLSSMRTRRRRRRRSGGTTTR